MFKQLYADNYKSLVNFELPLEELTLLLGPNGVGKTSVLDVFFALSRLLGRAVKVTDDHVFPTRTLTRRQSRDIQAFQVDIELEGDSLAYRIEIQHERPTQRARVQLEQLTAGGRPLFRCESGEVQLYRDDHSQGPKYSVDWSESALARVPPRRENTRLTRFLEFMRKVLVCGLYPASFRTESSSEDPVLDRTAQNFSGWYRHMFQEHMDLAPQFTQSVQDVIPGLSGIRLESVGLDTRAMMVVFEEDGIRYEFRLDELSDGQRAILAIYSLIHLTAGQGYTLFLDEPDNYVALPEIQPWLIALADSCGETVAQAVLCSHHPELIDYLGGDRGWLLKREQSGATRAGRLEAEDIENGLKLSEVVARGWEQCHPHSQTLRSRQA